MIRGFKDFVLRGNIIDLAIAVVIGTALAKVIDTFVTAIIRPIIAAFPGATINGWGFSLRGGVLKKSTFIDISAILNAVIVFVVTAAVVYFILVVPMQRIQELRARGVEPEPVAVDEQILLLREIRDALGARPADGTAGPTPTHPL